MIITYIDYSMDIRFIILCTMDDIISNFKKLFFNTGCSATDCCRNTTYISLHHPKVLRIVPQGWDQRTTLLYSRILELRCLSTRRSRSLPSVYLNGRLLVPSKLILNRIRTTVIPCLHMK